AGVRPGDLIVAYERERVEYPEQLARWVAATRPSTSVELVWVRDEVGHTGRAVLGQSPDPLPEWVTRDPDFDLPESGPGRISELEKGVRRLSDELSRIKAQGSPQHGAARLSCRPCPSTERSAFPPANNPAASSSAQVRSRAWGPGPRRPPERSGSRW